MAYPGKFSLLSRLGMLTAAAWLWIAPVAKAADAPTSAAPTAPAPAASTNAAPVPGSLAPSFSNPAPTVGIRPSDPPVVSGAQPTPPGITPPPSDTPAAALPNTPSTNVTINLISLMVKRGLITKEDAAGLIKEAQTEADTARAQAEAAQAAAQKVDLVADQAQKAAAAAAAATPPPTSEDDVRVPYVPEVVKDQIRDQVTQEVLKEDREGQLTSRDLTPDWVKRFHVTGDLRTRVQEDMFPSGNSPGQIFNFNAINTGSPLEFVDGAPFPNPVPSYNVDQDRQRLRLRARIGAEVDLSQNFSAGMRIGTGSDDQPVSQNQTLGGVSGGQGGDFGKYQIWLDRAFLRYEIGDATGSYFSASVGRFDNPFFSTSMIWADDLAFDGAAIQANYKVTDNFTPFVVGGAFPVFNTDLNFGTSALSTSPSGDAYASYDKWLYAGQIGANWKINDDFSFKGAVAFYDFQNIEGQVSAPVSEDLAQFPSFVGPTDDSRPGFAQKGNTYIALRNIVPDPTLPVTTPTYQYFGLATPFRELAFTAQLDYSHYDPIHIALIGEFVKNLAFDRTEIENNGPANFSGPVNNLGPDGTFDGGDIGYNLRLNIGNVSLEKLWDWNVGLTYRYLQSDAVVDGFNDADFGGVGGGGTNVQGYIIGGNLGLSSRVWLTARWLSFNAIAGPPFKEDIFQFDINAKF